MANTSRITLEVNYWKESGVEQSKVVWSECVTSENFWRIILELNDSYQNSDKLLQIALRQYGIIHHV